MKHIDLEHRYINARKTSKMLGTDKTQAKSHYNVTANEVAHQILNGKLTAASSKGRKHKVKEAIK
jgi:hypothetical protein